MTIHRGRTGRLPPLTSLFCGMAASLLTGTAFAETSPYYIGVVQSLAHESNLYRLGDGQEALLGPGRRKSDTLSVTSLIGGIDQNFSRQRVYGSLKAGMNRYASNKTLNNESYGLNLALDWATLERLSGTVSIGADQTLAQFNNRSGAGSIESVKNIVNTSRADAKFRLGMVTALTLEAGLGLRKVNYSATQYQRNEYEQTSGSLGARYRASGALQVGVALRLSKADYPQFRQTGAHTFESDTLNRRDIDFTANWTPSAISQVNLRLSPTQSSYDRNTGRDFSGLTGSAAWAWQVAGKTKLNTTLSRDTGQSSEAVNLGISQPGVVDYSQITSALRVKAEHELTGKIGLTASAVLAHRSLVNTPRDANGNVLTTLEGTDNTVTLALGGRWAVTRSAEAGCNVSTERRTSSNSALSVPMSGSSFSCYGQLVLQ